MPGKFHQYSIDTWPGLLAACLVAGIGGLSFNTLPLVSGLWAENYFYSADEIGHINGAQFSGFAIGILTSLFWVGKIAPRPIVITGLLCTSLVIVLPYLSSPKDWTLLLIMLGIANALVLAPVVALLGGATHVERAYGLMYALQMLLAIAVTFVVASSFLGAWDLSSALFLLGIVSLFGIAPALSLPGSKIIKTQQPYTTYRSHWLVITFILVGMLLFMLGMVGVWSFLDALELLKLESLNITIKVEQSLLVSIALIAALTGSLAAAWLGDRVGVFLPLLLGLLLVLAGITWMVISSSISVFWVGALSISFGWNFALAYATAELAHADRTGNLVTLSPGIIGLGGALGVAGLGSILATHGAVPFYSVAGIIILVGFIFLFLAVHFKPLRQLS